MTVTNSHSASLYKILQEHPKEIHLEGRLKSYIEMKRQWVVPGTARYLLNKHLDYEVYITQESVILSDGKIKGAGTYKTMLEGTRIVHGQTKVARVAFLILRTHRLNEQEIAMMEHFKEHGISLPILEKFTILYQGVPQPTTILIQPLAPHGDLYSFVLKEMSNTNSFPEDRIAFILYQLLHIARIIHDEDYVHRDMKLANFLVFPGDIIKACDLGSLMKNGDQKIPYFATKLYLSPDSAKSAKERNETSNHSSGDIWAIGVMLAILARSEPLQSWLHIPEIRQTKNVEEACEIIMRLCNAPPPSFQERPPTRIEQIALSYLQPYPEDRPTALKALQDPLLMQALRKSPSFFSAITDCEIPFEQVYQELFGQDLEIAHYVEALTEFEAARQINELNQIDL